MRSFYQLKDHQIDQEPTKNSSAKIDALVKSNNQFIFLIAHDLRGPLSTTISILSILNTTFKKGKVEETQEFIKMATLSAKRVVTLLEELTDWGISANKGESFSLSSINLLDLIVGEIEAIITTASLKQITVKYSISSALKITADREMLKTIVRNLLTNAIKFTPTSGKITISGYNNGSSIIILIKDTGVGISKKKQDILFDNSVHYSTTGTDNEIGKGLGLKICKQFMDIHQGTIHLTSKPEEGSEFKLTFPL